MEVREVVLITGASSGIGAALAEVYAKKGATLILWARRQSRLQELANKLTDMGATVKIITCDVTRDEQVETSMVESIKAFGRIDTIIANAGFGVAGTFRNLQLDDYRRQFETNIFGVLRTIKTVLPEIIKNHGRIAIVGSVAGYVPLPGSSPYSMSKASIKAFSDALYHELKPLGSSVTLISPGFVDSEIRRVDNLGVHKPGKDPIPHWLRMRTDLAARQIVKAIALRKREKVITGHGKIIVFLARHFTSVLHWLIGKANIRSRSEPVS